jgi:hypothetical protein
MNPTKQALTSPYRTPGRVTVKKTRADEAPMDRAAS